MIKVNKSLDAGFALAHAVKIAKHTTKQIEQKLIEDYSSENLELMFNYLYTASLDIQKILEEHIEK